jgi:serine/threonine-protein kinase RsbW
MAEPNLQLSMTARLDDLAEIRARVREFARACGLDAGAVDEVELAADEAVTNAVKHAYAPGRPARLEVRGEREGKKLVLAVRDFGRRYAPKPVSAAEVRRILMGHRAHGLGRFIMKRCMDEVRYRSVPRKYNETRMVKKIK